MNNLKKISCFLDNLGLICIGLISIGYVLLHKMFAELHLQFFFLDFPIFIGEWLLFFCFVLFSVKCVINKYNPPKWQRYLLIGYFVFIISKTLLGYCHFGPLALRNAALFYYPAFAIFGYSFYRKDFFSAKRRTVLFLTIISIFIFRYFYGYWTFTLAALGFILIRSYPQKLIEYSMVLMLLACIPYSEFFQTARMMIVANVSSGLYLAGTLPFILRVKKEFKLALMMFIGGVVMLGLFKFADFDAVKSVINFKKITEMFSLYNAKIEAMGSYQMAERKEVKLYNPEKFRQTQRAGDVSEEQMKTEIRKILGKHVKETIEDFSFEQLKDGTQKNVVEEVKKEMWVSLVGQVKEVIQAVPVDQIKEEMQLALEQGAIEKAPTIFEEQVENKEEMSSDFIAEVKEEMQLALEQGAIEKAPTDPGEEHYTANAVFRLFIWRDMLVELVNAKPILGFSFGKPLRSISLEALDWGADEWARDGWVGAHNSYLHIIYRAGVVGVLLIFSFLIILFKMIKKFILCKSLVGILLCSIIINWFMAANFLLIFELPYTAIPIWTIYGITLAFCYKNNENPNYS